MEGHAEVPIRVRVNGVERTAVVRADETLLECLRGRWRLTGAKEVCGEGECGACTVLLDGEPVAACLVLAAQADGRAVTTIEGVAADHPVLGAFLAGAAVQCGYCIPGMILSAVALGRRCPHPARADVVEAIEGNLCRCTGYQKIVRAIEEGLNR